MLATRAGVSVYDDYTVKELLWIHEEKESAAWDHTAAIVAMMHNTHAKRPKPLLDFHPYRRKIKKTGGSTGASLGDFKREIMRSKGKK